MKPENLIKYALTLLWLITLSIVGYLLYLIYSYLEQFISLLK